MPLAPERTSMLLAFHFREVQHFPVLPASFTLLGKERSDLWQGSRARQEFGGCPEGRCYEWNFPPKVHAEALS